MRGRTGLFRGMLSLRGQKGNGGGTQGWVGYMDLGIRREAWAGGGDPGLISWKQLLRLQEAGGARPGRVSEWPREGLQWSS